MPETWGSWSTKFLKALGAPASKENLACLYAIIGHEGTKFTWNPLAISGGGSGSNSSGVGNFPDEATGIRNTVNFLNTPGAQDYPGRIVKPLQTGDGLKALHGIDATGAWSGDFPGAYDSYNLFVKDSSATGPYGNSPLLADPGHGAGDIGAASGSITDVLGVPNPLSGLEAIGHFFSILGEGSTWVRVGEVMGGVIILAFAFGILRNDIYAPVKAGSGLIDKAKTIAEIGAVVG
jgi:hypothetical protein